MFQASLDVERVGMHLVNWRLTSTLHVSIQSPNTDAYSETLWMLASSTTMLAHPLPRLDDRGEQGVVDVGLSLTTNNVYQVWPRQSAASTGMALRDCPSPVTLTVTARRQLVTRIHV